jgi:hypothetical protein
MATKLMFQDSSRTPLREGCIALSFGDPVPKLGEVVTLPSGVRVKVVGRQLNYTLACGPVTDLKLTYDCEVF